MLAQSQKMMATLLNEKEKDFFYKLPKWDVKCEGDKKDRSGDNLVRIA